MLTRPEAVILFGPSQYGKSSFVDCLLPEGVAKRASVIGTDENSSTTLPAQRICESYGTRIGFVLDTVGYNDPNSTITSTDLANPIKMALTNHGIQYARFLVFESLNESSIQLPLTIQKLIEAFGMDVKKSIIVIATKEDKADEEERIGRLETIRECMQDLDIGETLVPWKNKRFTDEEFDFQLDYLKSAIRDHKDVVYIDRPDFCPGDHVYQPQHETNLLRHRRHGIVVDVHFNSTSHSWFLRIASLSKSSSSTSTHCIVYSEKNSSCDKTSSPCSRWHRVDYNMDTSGSLSPLCSGDEVTDHVYTEDTLAPMLVSETDDFQKEQLSIAAVEDQASDPPQMVLARVKFLKEVPHLVPDSSDFEADAESFAVWCKTGKWESLPRLDVWRILALAAPLVATSAIEVQVPADGLWGFLGYTTSVPLAIAQPLVLPTIAVGVGVLSALHEHGKRKQFKKSVKLLTEAFECMLSTNHEPLSE